MTNGSNFRTKEAITPENIELAIQTFKGIESGMDALIEASYRPENQAFAADLLDRAVELFGVAASLRDGSPVK